MRFHAVTSAAFATFVTSACALSTTLGVTCSTATDTTKVSSVPTSTATSYVGCQGTTLSGTHTETKLVRKTITSTAHTTTVKTPTTTITTTPTITISSRSTKTIPISSGFEPILSTCNDCEYNDAKRLPPQPSRSSYAAGSSPIPSGSAAARRFRRETAHEYPQSVECTATVATKCSGTIVTTTKTVTRKKLKTTTTVTITSTSTADTSKVTETAPTSTVNINTAPAAVYYEACAANNRADSYQGSDSHWTIFENEGVQAQLQFTNAYEKLTPYECCAAAMKHSPGTVVIWSILANEGCGWIHLNSTGACSQGQSTVGWEAGPSSFSEYHVVGQGDCGSVV